MRRMFELLSVARRADHHIRLGTPFHLELCWWALFLGEWSGVAMLPAQCMGLSSHHVWMDASGIFSAVYAGRQQWIQHLVYGVGEAALGEESITSCSWWC